MGRNFGRLPEGKDVSNWLSDVRMDHRSRTQVVGSIVRIGEGKSRGLNTVSEVSEHHLANQGRDKGVKFSFISLLKTIY